MPPASILKPGQKIAMCYVNFIVDIVEKFFIKIIDWPAGVPFIKPADIGDIVLLRRLVTAFKSGTTYWRPLTKPEKRKLEDEVKARKDAGVLAKKQRAKRSDAGMKRGARVNKRKANNTSNKENGSAPKRARTGNNGEGSSTGAFKSRQLIGSDEDGGGEMESSDEDIRLEGQGNI